MQRKIFFAFSFLVAACGSNQPAAVAPCPSTPPTTVASTPAPSIASSAPSVASSTTIAAPQTSPPIDEKSVADATGGATEKSADGVVKATWPRKDVPVQIDGWSAPPFMGLTSWVAFSPGKQGVAEAMMMGDLVVFEDEVNPVMSKLLDGGVDVTALHNHFFYEAPRVFFMHVGGEGAVAKLGGAVRAAMDEIAAIRKKAPKPASTFAAPKLPAKSTIDGASLEAIFGGKGAAKDGMWKGVWGHAVTASCGCAMGKSMGVSTWAAFAGSDDDAVVDGDFAASEGELQGVLKALRAGGVNVVAIHSHMTGESPRLLFLHYWGRGKARELATTVKKALDLTAWDGKEKGA